MSKRTFQISRVGDAIFASFNPAALSFHRDSFHMALLRKDLRLLKVFSLVVMRHIHHYRVDRQCCNNLTDLLDILRVVDVQAQWN